MDYIRIRATRLGILLGVLAAQDLNLSLCLFAHGAIEVNPIMAAALNLWGPIGFAIAKIIPTAFGISILVYTRAIISLIVLCVIFAALVAYEITMVLAL